MTDQDGKGKEEEKKKTTTTLFTADDYLIMRDFGFNVEKNSLDMFVMNDTIVVTNVLNKLYRDLFQFSKGIEGWEDRFNWNHFFKQSSTRTNKEIYQHLCDFVVQYLRFLRVEFQPSSFKCVGLLKTTFYTGTIRRENTTRLKGLLNTIRNSLLSHLLDKVFMNVVKHQ